MGKEKRKGVADRSQTIESMNAMQKIFDGETEVWKLCFQTPCSQKLASYGYLQEKNKSGRETVLWNWVLFRYCF